MAFSLATFPIIFWSIRNLGPFFGGADIGAGLLLMASLIVIIPLIAVLFFKSPNWSRSKAFAIAGCILAVNFGLSITNHFILLRQHQDYKSKSVLNCESSPYHCAIRDRKLDEISLLKKQGRDIESKDGWGRTALYYAFYSNVGPEYFEALLSQGANPNAVDANGHTLFAELVLNNPKNYELAKLFLKHGYNVNLAYGGKSKYLLLNTAVIQKDNEAIDFLLDHGADPFMKDRFEYNACDRLKVHSVEPTEKLKMKCKL